MALQISLKTYLLCPDLFSTVDGYWHYWPVQSMDHCYDIKVSAVHIIEKINSYKLFSCWGMCERYARVADNVHIIIPAWQVVPVRADKRVQDGVGDWEGDKPRCPSASPAGFGHVVSFKLSVSYRYHWHRSDTPAAGRTDGILSDSGFHPSASFKKHCFTSCDPALSFTKVQLGEWRWCSFLIPATLGHKKFLPVIRCHYDFSISRSRWLCHIDNCWLVDHINQIREPTHLILLLHEVKAPIWAKFHMPRDTYSIGSRHCLHRYRNQTC